MSFIHFLKNDFNKELNTVELLTDIGCNFFFVKDLTPC